MLLFCPADIDICGRWFFQRTPVSSPPDASRVTTLVEAIEMFDPSSRVT